MQGAFEFAAKPESAPAPKSSTTQVSTGTAARLMNVSQSTIGRLCEEGLLRAWRVTDRGWWRIDYGSVLELLRRRRDPTLFPDK